MYVQKGSGPLYKHCRGYHYRVKWSLFSS